MDRRKSYREVMGERLKEMRMQRGIDIVSVAAKGGISVSQAKAVEKGSDPYSIDALLGYVSGSDLYMYFATKSDMPGQEEMIRKGAENHPGN